MVGALADRIRAQGHRRERIKARVRHVAGAFGEREGVGVMEGESDLIERLCRSLAFHLIESENTARMAEGEENPWAEEIARARSLIGEAGFDIDALYPVSERPIVTPEDEMDLELLAELRGGRRVQ